MRREEVTLDKSLIEKLEKNFKDGNDNVGVPVIVETRHILHYSKDNTFPDGFINEYTRHDENDWWVSVFRTKICEMIKTNGRNR